MCKDLEKLQGSAQSPDRPIEVGIGIVLRAAPRLSGPKVGHTLSTLEILITRRPPGTVYEGFWELPGGKAEQSEAIEACVVREIMEEVGLSVRVIHNLRPLIHRYEHGTVRLYPHVCVRNETGQEPEAVQVADVRWTRLDELGRFRFPEANGTVFERFREWVLGGG